jgi:hypothetical protein
MAKWALLLMLLTAAHAQAAPDAVVTSLTYDKGIFTSEVKNQGTTAIPANTIIGVGYRVDDVSRTYGSVMGPLAAGASVTVGSNGGAYVLPPGQHTLMAFVDDVNRFAEADETNNKLTKIVESTPPEPPPPSPSRAGAAYPGAQGSGALTKGGRDGVIIQVTNLNDAGAGSLRACLLATMPRICVFRVGGTIQLKERLAVRSPYITVAGQTAPGGGILISGKGMADNLFGVATHDVIIQYLRFRKGYSTGCSNSTTSDCGAALNLWSGAYNAILDHNSVSWNQDEGIGIYDNDAAKPRIKDVTASYNLIAEGLASHSTGFLTGGVSKLAAQMTAIDLHHNLTVTNSHRNPLALNKSIRLVNNVYYNQGYYVNQMGGGISADIINNLYKAGPLNTAWVHEIQGFATTTADNASPGSPSLYLTGNKGWHQLDPAGDQWKLASKVGGENGSDRVGTPIPTAWRRAIPLATSVFPIVTQSVVTLEAVVLSQAGASHSLTCTGGWVANRDSVDARLVRQYQTNTGATSVPKTEADVGGFPVIAGGTPCADNDKDGMADVWEVAHKLNPNNAADRNFIALNGYRNLENYLAGF